MIRKFLLSELSAQIPLDDFSYICFSSFETRCLSVARIVKNSKMSSSAIFFYDEFSQCTSSHLAKLKKYLKRNTQIFMLGTSSPWSTADSFNSYISTLKQNGLRKLLVDITCFNREALLILLNILNARKVDFDSIYFVYTEANRMSDFLSFGVRDIRSVLGYPGIVSPLKKDHLVLLFGYEFDRARSLIEAYEPSAISISVPSVDASISPSLYKKHTKFRTKLNTFVELLQSFYGKEVHFFDLSLIDPYAARDQLASHIRTVSSYNTIIAPLNTKISTVGAGLCALKLPNVQITYSQMSAYNYSSYSTPGTSCYLFQPFGQ